jgi:hypothetical protein
MGSSACVGEACTVQARRNPAFYEPGVVVFSHHSSVGVRWGWHGYCKVLGLLALGMRTLVGGELIEDFISSPFSAFCYRLICCDLFNRSLSRSARAQTSKRREFVIFKSRVSNCKDGTRCEVSATCGEE